MGITAYIPFKPSPHTGKGFFCKRLYLAMERMGHSVVSSHEDSHNVSLHMVKIGPGKGKRVMRLDGVWHNSDMGYKSRNKKIKKNLHRCDGVVYQSKFSKSLCDKYLGKFKNGPVGIIPNGSDLSFYKQCKPADTGFKYNFLSASRWRPHKRLRDIIESFLLADIPDSALFIAGNLKDCGVSKPDRKKYLKRKNIIHLGQVDQNILGSYLKSCAGFIHLCWFDNCPNAVVESVCAGVPVVCNNVGGTHEIVRPSNGIVCEIDSPYNLKPVKLYSPPKVDRRKIAEGIRGCINRREICNDHVNINTVAKKYWKFFEKVI